MNEEIEKAIEDSIAKVRESEQHSLDAVQWSQTVLNLCNARACLRQTQKSDELIGLLS